MEIREQIKQLFGELADEVSNVSLLSLEFVFLDSIRITSLQDLRPGFDNENRIRDTFLRKIKGCVIPDEDLKSPSLSQKQIERIVDKAIGLLHEKIKNVGTNNKWVFGEYLYDDYPAISAGKIDYSRFQNNELVGSKVFVAGRVISKKSRKASGKKSDFVYLTLQGLDGQKIDILISSTFYPGYKSDLVNIQGKYIGIMGEIKWDDYRKENIIAVYELEVPNGYVIERDPVQLRNYHTKNQKRKSV